MLYILDNYFQIVCARNNACFGCKKPSPHVRYKKINVDHDLTNIIKVFDFFANALLGDHSLAQMVEVDNYHSVHF